MATRQRLIDAADPGGEPVCLLTRNEAFGREVPIDRLLVAGTFAALNLGYEITLPPGEEHWSLASRFAEEEATCCPSLTFNIDESEAGIVVRASFRR